MLRKALMDLPLINGESGERICERIRFAFDVLKLHSVLIKKQPPAENPLRLEVGKRVVLVVCVDRDVWTSVKHCAVLFESLYDEKDLFLADRIILLRAIELA